MKIPRLVLMLLASFGSGFLWGFIDMGLAILENRPTNDLVYGMGFVMGAVLFLYYTKQDKQD